MVPAVRGSSGALLLLLGAVGSWGAVGCDDTKLGQVRPVVSVDQTQLDFGVVPIGAVKRIGVTVRNIGTQDLTIESLRPMLSAVNASGLNPFFAEPAGSTTVASGGQLTVDVGFAPNVNELASGTLIMTSDDPETPELRISLGGRGGVGQLVLQPDVLDVQDTTVGRTRSVELVVQNLGNAPVQDARLVSEGFARPSHYRLTGLPAFDQPVPFALDARSRQVLLLTYEPQEIGNDEGRIRIETCGLRCGPEVAVLGSANEAVLRLVPPSLDFGAAGLGQPRSEVIQVENVGLSAARIDSVTVTGDGDYSVSVPGGDPPQVLQPAERLGLTVTFRPTEAAVARGAVVVRTNLGAAPELQATLAGRGAGPLFVVRPATLNFGTERGPGRYQRSVLLNNAGSSQVQISALNLAGGTGAAALSLGVVPGLPVRLGPGESLVLPIVFEPSTPGMSSADLMVSSDYPEQPTATVPITAAMSEALCQLEVTPGQIKFGLMPPGHRRVRRVEVRNVGPDVCRLESGDFRAPADSAMRLEAGPTFPVDLFPQTSSAGESLATFDFSYQPVERRAAKATFVLQTSDEFFPERTISLLGRSDEYRLLFMRPESLDFGAMTPVLCPEFVNNVRLFNVGGASVRHLQSRLTSPTLSAVSPEFRLAVESVPAAFEAIPGGGAVRYDVGYRALDLGRDGAELEVEIEGFSQPFVVPLSGEGSDDPRRFEEFQQVDNKEVDVLFVIDDSCSMEENQRRVAENFDSFIDAADARDVDFHLGITTTDTFLSPGELVGPIVTRDTPDFKEEFKNQAAVGVLGSGFETGLEAMQAALDEADRGNGFNADLIRPTAALVVIIVSDEDDQSFLSPAQYANNLAQRTLNGVLPAVVSGQENGCSSSAGIADPAPIYEEFLDFFGNGISASICADWGTTLAALGGEAFGLRRAFRLALRPAADPAPIVTINGNVTSAYTVVGSDVIFDQPPPEGAVIRVDYSPDC